VSGSSRAATGAAARRTAARTPAASRSLAACARPAAAAPRGGRLAFFRLGVRRRVEAAGQDDAVLPLVLVPELLQRGEALGLARRKVELLGGVGPQVEQRPTALTVRCVGIPDDLPIALANHAVAVELDAEPVRVVLELAGAEQLR